jgi:hypothetical protein
MTSTVIIVTVMIIPAMVFQFFRRCGKPPFKLTYLSCDIIGVLENMSQKSFSRTFLNSRVVNKFFNFFIASFSRRNALVNTTPGEYPLSLMRIMNTGKETSPGGSTKSASVGMGEF